MPRRLRASQAIALITVLVLSALLGAAQKRGGAAGRPSLPERIIQSIVSPFERGFYGMCAPIRHVKMSLRTRNRLQRENNRLRAKALRLTRENAKLPELIAENARFREALDFAKSGSERMLFCRVITLQPSRHFDTCILDRGSREGIRRESIVVAPRGLVGRVFKTTHTTCHVLLLRDATSAVGAMVQRSRAMGICEGQQSATLILNYLPRDADVHVGDVVISSGMGGVYPKGFTIGRVVRIVSKPADFLKSAEVAPSVNFDSLEEAFVILRGDE